MAMYTGGRILPGNISNVTFQQSLAAYTPVAEQAAGEALHGLTPTASAAPGFGRAETRAGRPAVPAVTLAGYGRPCRRSQCACRPKLFKSEGWAFWYWGKTVLDVAYSEGYGAAQLALRARAMVGIDNVAATINRAKNTYRRVSGHGST